MPETETSATRALGGAALVAAAGIVTAVPHLYYSMRVISRGDGAARIASVEPGALLRAEFVSVAFVTVVAALSGALLASRYQLAGLGSHAAVVSARRHYLLALLVGAVSYLVLGRQLAERVPATYPPEVGWAVARLLKSAVFEEVVARFGMMTIFCGAVRNVAVANLLQSVFFTLLGILGLAAYGLELQPTPLLVASAAVTLATHVWLGTLYARWGLLSAIVAHGALAAPYLAHALWSSFA